MHLGPFEGVRGLRYSAPFPGMMRVRQHFSAPEVANPGARTFEVLQPLRALVTPGMRVAITAGSRGVHDLPSVVRATGEFLRGVGALPFIVPAMGSHGGATADGQTSTLAKLGVTEATMGMPVRATMDTVELARLPGGPAVHLDRLVAEADGVVVINRVKAHTDFRGEVESGLAKITAIGLGNQRGAEGIHAFGPANLAVWVPQVAARIVATGKVLGGVAIVENAYHRAARIEFVEAGDIGGPVEAELLAEAKQLMARLPFDELDVLVVDEMGKDKSGAGMDTNVLGRMLIRGTPEPIRPRIANVVVLDLSGPSAGNAIGLGLADFIPFRILEKIDLHTTYLNAMTSGLGGPQRGQVPLALATDRDAVAAAILTCGRADCARARVVRVHDTLDLAELQVSSSLSELVHAHPRLEVLSKPGSMTFDADGTIGGWY